MIIQPSRRYRIGEALPANPLPIVLIGIGIAWLLAGNIGAADGVTRDRRVQAVRRRLAAIAGGGARRQNGTRQTVGPSGEPVAHTGAGQVSGWVHQAAGAARGAVGSVRDAGTAVLDRAGSVAGYAGDAGRRISGQLVGKIERDPWLLGVAGFVVGAVLAAMLPPTRTEQELLAGTREELRNKAAEFGHEAAERVREFADATPRAARY